MRGAGLEPAMDLRPAGLKPAALDLTRPPTHEAKGVGESIPQLTNNAAVSVVNGELFQ